jgi:hypothetical protein
MDAISQKYSSRTGGSMFRVDIKISVLLAAVMVVCSSCEEQAAVREYEEKLTVAPTPTPTRTGDPHAFMKDAPFMDMSADTRLPAGQGAPDMRKVLDASVVRPALSWTTPEGWEEKAGSGMRLVTFKAPSAGGDVECSVVSLGGNAGGLEQNVLRWIGQIGASAPAGGQLQDFLSRQETVQTAGGFSMTLVDLTELSAGDDAPSMLGAVAGLDAMTVFVKLTGVKKAVLEHKTAFKALCESLKLN